MPASPLTPSRIFLTLLTLTLTVFSPFITLSLVGPTGVEARFYKPNDIHARLAEAGHRYAQRFHHPDGPGSSIGRRQAQSGSGNGGSQGSLGVGSGSGSSPGKSVNTTMTFSSPKAKNFLVNGTGLPDVDWDVGPSYAGLLPISGAKNESRQLFFWFFPPALGASTDDLTIWLNGGPGCSSLKGAIQENGPISWGVGQAKPMPNPFSWTNLSGVLYVDQPVGTGFSQGTPSVQDENDVAEQFVGFLQQFLGVFSELKKKKLFLTGESYAGTYVPYIANFIHENPTKLDLDLQGIWMSDPAISWNVVQGEITVLDFVKQNQNVFALNATFMSHLETVSAQCNYTNYTSTHLTYPPSGPLPLPGNSTFADPGCDIWDMVFRAAISVNPAFNIYRIFDTFPVLWDVLGFPGSFPQEQTPVYFNRTDVQKAIHAPPNAQWAQCTTENVFVDQDNSLPPALTVLPSVIEKTNRTVIVHGLADYVFMAEGTRIAIQNMTWAGQQGFQTPIEPDTFILDSGTALGNSHVERGLAYVEVALSGHMVPQYSPVAAFQIMEYVMGIRDDLVLSNFTQTTTLVDTPIVIS